MSWWISLNDADGEPLQVESFQDGGTQVMGGSTEADLNVTYNYGDKFRFPDLDKHTAKFTVPMLEAAVENLGTERDADYWKSTPGNVGHACAILLSWARQHPTGTWRVS